METLEARLALSADGFTAFEQLLLELVNRERMAPEAAVSRFNLLDLNEGIDPAGGLITSTPKQPLAPNDFLANAAIGHAEDMLARDYFSHTDLNGGTPSSRAIAAGYTSGAGENIAWAGTTGTIDQLAQVYARHESLFLSPGHRHNLMTDSYRELGTGIAFGVYTTTPPTTSSTINWNAIMVVENFGSQGGGSFITGVAITDSVVANDFYDVGEGVGSLRITAVNTADGRSYYTETGAAGGYALQVPDGTYTVTANGGELTQPLVTEGVVVASANVKVDFETLTPPDSALEIVGRADDGGWWVAEKDGNSLTTSQWGRWSSAVNWQDVTTLDFNGDGLTDIAGRVNGAWWLAVSTGSSFVNRSIASWSSGIAWTSVMAGDFDGDGMDDIVGRSPEGSWWVGISNGSSMTTSYWGRWNPIAWRNISVADFDGDGRDDVVGRATDGSWWVGKSTGSAFATTSWARWSNTANWQDIRIGDVNGDGRADIVGRTGTGGAWWVGTSLGNRFDTKAWARWSAIDWQDVFLGDFNGDGRDDIIGRAAGLWWVARSTGSTFITASWGSAVVAESADAVIVGDQDGDGDDDLIMCVNGAWSAAVSNGSRFNNMSLQHQWADIAWADLALEDFA